MTLTLACFRVTRLPSFVLLVLTLSDLHEMRRGKRPLFAKSFKSMNCIFCTVWRSTNKCFGAECIYFRVKLMSCLGEANPVASFLRKFHAKTVARFTNFDYSLFFAGRLRSFQTQTRASNNR